MPRWFLLLLFAAIGLIAAIGSRLPAAQPLEYRFKAGERLDYELVRKADLLADPTVVTPPRDKEIRFSVLPVRQNADRSWRLLIRTTVRYLKFPEEGGEPTVRFAHDQLGWVDVRPDGTYQKNRTVRDNLLFGLFPEYALIPLPGGGVPGETRVPSNDWRYSLRAAPIAKERWRISGTISDPIDARYDNHRELIADFDRGRVIEKTIVSSGGDPDDRFRNEQVVRLVGVEQEPLDRVGRFDREATGYFETLGAWWAALEAASTARDEAACRERIDAVRSRITDRLSEELLTRTASLYDALLVLHDREAQGAIDAARDRQALYEQEPIDWVTNDLEGNRFSRPDYEGRLVLLDFWYRGCPHCIRQLPEIKQLAEKHTNRGLVVVGINNDHDPDNARHVIRAFGIEHQTLRNAAAEPIRLGDGGEPVAKISQAYRVRAWPTLILLDRLGRIAHVQSGTNSELVEDFTRVIESLDETAN